MEQSDSTAKFLAAFNAIENHFKFRLSDDVSKFTPLAEKYADKFGMRPHDLRTLRVYAQLRNFLAHNDYYDGKPIAQPVAGIVQEIEALRDKVLRPPTVLSVLPHRSLVRFSPDDPVSSVLDEVRKNDYSQFPIYDGHAYRGLLTTNCIGRWLASRLASVGLVETEPVSAVMKFAEPQDNAAPLPRTATVQRAINKLSPPADGHLPPAALIIKDSGKLDERPLAIVVAEDLAVLFQSA